jgi:hypothetical protein
MPQPYEKVTSEFAEATGAHVMTEREATELLELARRVARTSDDRRSAPLVCYLAGQLVAREFDAEARIAQIVELVARFPEPAEQ